MHEDDAAGGGVELNENASHLLERIESMSVRELKQLIAQAGLSTDDVVEKADLRARALSVLALNPSAAPPEVPQPTNAPEEPLIEREPPLPTAARPARFVHLKEEGVDDQPASSGPQGGVTGRMRGLLVTGIAVSMLLVTGGVAVASTVSPARAACTRRRPRLCKIYMKHPGKNNKI